MVVDGAASWAVNRALRRRHRFGKPLFTVDGASEGLRRLSVHLTPLDPSQARVPNLSKTKADL
eukprot:2030923-Alexandrium_andersonii.AAC.1